MLKTRGSRMVLALAILIHCGCQMPSAFAQDGLGPTPTTPVPGQDIAAVGRWGPMIENGLIAGMRIGPPGKQFRTIGLEDGDLVVALDGRRFLDEGIDLAIELGGRFEADAAVNITVQRGANTLTLHYPGGQRR